MGVWNQAAVKFLAKKGIEAEENLGNILFSFTIYESADYLAENYGLRETQQEIIAGIMAEVEDYYFNRAQLKPGAQELLEAIREKGIPMSVATSTDKYCIDAAFERLGISDWFEVVLSCSDVGKSKEFPDIFYMAIDAMKTSVEDTWVFEDGLYSIKTAKKAGFKTVGVYDEVSKKDQPEIKAVSDIYLTDLRDFDGKIIE